MSQTTAAQVRHLQERLKAVEAELSEIKEKGAAYMQAVNAMLAAAERDGLLKPGSVWAHAQATSDAVKHVFGIVQ